MRRPLAALLLLLGGAMHAQAQEAARAPSPTPTEVVQRFVDAANARDADAMARLVAPAAVFERFPGGRIVMQGRDSIRARYARSLGGRPPEFRITVASRIVEGEIVIDQEEIVGEPGGPRKATWMYLVRGGLIQRAWVVDGASAP